MEIYEIDGEKYYLVKRKIYDSSFIELDQTRMAQIAPKLFREAFPTDRLDWDDTLEYIKTVKACGQYGIGIEASLWGLDKFGDLPAFVDAVLPLLTSLYRLTGQPQRAIDDAARFVRLCSLTYTTALSTSVAAAYCDLGDTVNAKKFADRAYAQQGGSRGEENELSLVYKRIQKLTET